MQAKRIEELGRSLAEQRTANALHATQLKCVMAENKELRQQCTEDTEVQQQADQRKLEVMARSLERERENAQREHEEHMSVVSELKVVRAELSAMQAAKRDSETLRENENGGKLLQIGSRARRAAAAAATADASPVKKRRPLTSTKENARRRQAWSSGGNGEIGGGAVQKRSVKPSRPVSPTQCSPAVEHAKALLHKADELQQKTGEVGGALKRLHADARRTQRYLSPTGAVVTTTHAVPHGTHSRRHSRTPSAAPATRGSSTQRSRGGRGGAQCSSNCAASAGGSTPIPDRRVPLETGLGNSAGRRCGSGGGGGGGGGGSSGGGDGGGGGGGGRSSTEGYPQKGRAPQNAQQRVGRIGSAERRRKALQVEAQEKRFAADLERRRVWRQEQLATRDAELEDRARSVNRRLRPVVSTSPHLQTILCCGRFYCIHIRFVFLCMFYCCGCCPFFVFLHR